MATPSGFERFYRTTSKVGPYEPKFFPWPCPSVDVMKKAWSAVKALIDAEVGKEGLEKLKDENTQVHPLFKRLLEIALKELGIGASIIMNREVMGIAGKRPDFVLAPPGLEQVPPSKVVVVGELKLPGDIKAGLPQAWKYWHPIVSSFPLNDVNKLPIAIASDLNYVYIIKPKFHEENQLFLPSQSPCIVDPCLVGWDLPSPGFTALMHALNRTCGEVIKVKIDKLDRDVKAVYVDNPVRAVYCVQYGSQDIVVKVSQADVPSYEIDRERDNYFLLRCVFRPLFDDFTVPLLEDVKVERGFALAAGKVITQATDVILCKSKLAAAFKNILSGVKTLHSKSYVHMDIRPMNIVMYKGTARFIDLLTMQENGKHRSRYHGLDTFWPTKTENYWSESGNIKRGFEWDLCCLSLTFAALDFCTEEKGLDLFIAIRKEWEHYALTGNDYIDDGDKVRASEVGIIAMKMFAEVEGIVETNQAFHQHIYDTYITKLDEYIKSHQ